MDFTNSGGSVIIQFYLRYLSVSSPHLDYTGSCGNSYDQGPNRLHEPLLDGEEIVFDLGHYTAEEVSYGFFVQIYNEESERLDLNDAPELLVDGAVYEVLPEYEYVISLPQ